MRKNGLSIIIPTFNESSNIKSLIKQIVWAFLGTTTPYEIIVVDDHSTDQTRRIVQACSKIYPVRLINKNGRSGKGYSILQGYSQAIYEYIGIMDADTDATQIPEYLLRLLDLATEYGYAYAETSSVHKNRFTPHTIAQGPKIFKREIIEYLDLSQVSSWIIDLPLIYTARGLGYRGTHLSINAGHLHRRKSLIDRVNRTSQKLRVLAQHYLGQKPIYTFSPTAKNTMLGAGVAHRGKRFVTHSTLPVELSALTTFTTWQSHTILALLTLFSLGIVYDTRLTLIIVTATLSFVYLLDVIFNLVVTLKSLHFPPELTITDEQVAALKDRDLPMYSILCPLYKEARVLPHFVQSMTSLDWPKNKLEVLLLLEEDDLETIQAARTMKLPREFRLLIVPHSHPKTKPKACNYGLAHARGEYIVIFDAEDQPENSQLKKAYLAFRESPERVACLQAKLNYYNPRHNLLTRLFTAEYSLWFDVILPGLQSIKTSIPLGGTSNHFRTKILHELKGWDPFNVTEDADLGTRLFSAGYQTAIIDSNTLEEANSDVKNWFRQRSRWLKGYMQTYLVHMRRPLSLVKKQGWHAFIFQLVIGGKIAFILINPFLWVMTLSYFLLYRYVGPQIESIYPTYVFYMALISLLVGNFVALYNYMIGVVKRGHWDLVKHVYLIPLYWIGISYAAAIALFQLIFKPHYWEKTIHGLHLIKAEKKAAQVAAKALSREKLGHKVQQVADLIRGSFSAGGAIVLAAIIGNFLNFLYNAYLGRHLTLEDFGAINLFGSLFLFTQVPIGALGNAVTHKVAYLLGKYQTPVKDFWRRIRHRSLVIASIATVVYLALTPLLKNYFNFDNYLPFILFTPSIIIGTLAAVDGGYFGGILLFSTLAIQTIIESVAKLSFAVGLVQFGLHEYMYAVIPLSMSTSFILGYYLIRRMHNKSVKIDSVQDLRFPRQFYFTSILTSLTSLAYTTMDVVLAKHYLSPVDAGIYSYLSLAGKMVFLTSGMFSGFIVPYVSKAVGEGREGRRFFQRILLLVTLASLFSFIVFGLFGSLTTPILWGDRAAGILPYLIPYALSMVAYSISSLYVKYHLVRGENIFAYAGFAVAVAQTVAIFVNHGGISEIAESVVIASIFSLTLMVLLDRFYSQAIDLYHAYIDFLGLWKPIPKIEPLSNGKLRILIFNWRDLRHKWAGGAEVYLHELSKRWATMGHRVTIFAGNDGTSARFEKVDGVSYVRRGGFYLVYLWAFLYYFFRLRGRYDIIIDSENGLPFFTPLYVHEKVFLLIHHVHQEVFRNSLLPPFSWLAAFLEKKVMPLVYRKTEVITVSPSSKTEILLHKLTKHDPHVVYNGVDLKKCKPGKKSPVPTILYLGRLTTAKSVHILIRAAESIINSIPSVQIIIAGDGPTRNMLIKLVKKLGLSEHVSFTGKVSEEEKVRLYQQAWVFVNPSLIEGWGITTIEANACGTPVVASNVAGLRDAVHNPHSGLLVSYGNVEGFASAIIEILGNTKVRNRMSRESIIWAKQFGWDKSAKVGANIIGGRL